MGFMPFLPLRAAFASASAGASSGCLRLQYEHSRPATPARTSFPQIPNTSTMPGASSVYSGSSRARVPGTPPETFRMSKTAMRREPKNAEASFQSSRCRPVHPNMAAAPWPGGVR